MSARDDTYLELLEEVHAACRGGRLVFAEQMAWMCRLWLDAHHRGRWFDQTLGDEQTHADAPEPVLRILRARTTPSPRETDVTEDRSPVSPPPPPPPKDPASVKRVGGKRQRGPSEDDIAALGLGEHLVVPAGEIAVSGVVQRITKMRAAMRGQGRTLLPVFDVYEASDQRVVIKRVR